ncbi:hypothetical protein DVK00_19755 [Haloarcula sp. Atlit-47R]|uniref:zinc ribbon domain-containing protein n=1 Tax=Haloarcula sp. Atlit-47R TaxID=2282132 RepID=UPI000EF206FA|nr:hypothetical protein DVK00_19755 [Haloarcula sp. Atlit-47R]
MLSEREIKLNRVDESTPPRHAFARLQGRIKNKARTAGIPVTYAYPEYTSQACLDY